MSFGKALQVGLLIMLIASVCYCRHLGIRLPQSRSRLPRQVRGILLEKLKQSGASAEQIAAKAQEMAKFKTMYQNPLVNIAFTLLEPLPVGLLFTLVAAAVLSRKRRSPGGGRLVLGFRLRAGIHSQSRRTPRTQRAQKEQEIALWSSCTLCPLCLILETILHFQGRRKRHYGCPACCSSPTIPPAGAGVVAPAPSICLNAGLIDRLHAGGHRVVGTQLIEDDPAPVTGRDPDGLRAHAASGYRGSQCSRRRALSL